MTIKTKSIVFASIVIIVGAFLYYFTYVDIATNKYPSVSKINIKFEEYRLNFAPAQNTNSAFGSLHVKNDNDYYIVIKLKCDTNGIPNIGCKQVSTDAGMGEEIIEIEGRKIDGDIIQPHENKLLSFKVYATNYPISTGNFLLKLNLFADNKCPSMLINKDGYSSCSSEQNSFLLEETPIYLTII